MPAEENLNDFQKMIRALMEKRAQIDAAISNLVAASGALVPGEVASAIPFTMPGTNDAQPTELPRGAFLGKSLPAAIKLYLTAMRGKKTVKEISAALREGGIESTSDDFDGVLTGSLNRMKANGELLRFKEGWALAEFYPEHLRRSLSHGGGTKAKTASKKTKKAKKTAKAAKATPQDSPKAQPVPGAADQIAALLNKNPGVFFSPVQIADFVPGLAPAVISMMMGKLVPKHSWEKSPDGKYRAGWLRGEDCGRG